MPNDKTSPVPASEETIQHTALIRIVRSAAAGQEPVSDVFTKIEQLAGAAVVPVENALESFVKQFATDFGSQVLTQAATLAPAVLAGTTSIQDAAATLGTQVTADAITDAEKDGTVALNALRVQVEAQKAAPAQTPAADEADKNQAAGTE